MSILKRKTKKTDTAKEKTETATQVAVVMNAKPVVIAPRVTEKAAISQSQNKYTFLVELSATKGQVKRAVAAEYKVTPTAVNLMNVQGKHKRSNRGMGRRSDFKKAVVTLPKGQSIAIHEGV